MAIILLIKTEEGEPTELPILNKVVMCRSSTADFKIEDPKISGTHCSFEINGKGQLVFTDLGSTNGSFLNNSHIRQTLVRINDVIRIGNTYISLVSSRLGPSERLEIGVSTNVPDSKTLPEANPFKRKTIVLNKNIKKAKKITSKWDSAENVIDQEETGHTKFLKLDGKKKKP